MRREVGFWLFVYGLLFGFLALGLLVVVLTELGIPSVVSQGIGIAALAAYLVSVWWVFLR